MNIFISFSRIEQHISILEEEKNCVQIIKENFRIYHQMHMEEQQIDLNSFRKSMEDLDKLEKSIQFRIDFLESLVIDFRKIKNDNQILLEELEERLRQLNLDSTHL